MSNRLLKGLPALLLLPPPPSHPSARQVDILYIPLQQRII